MPVGAQKIIQWHEIRTVNNVVPKQYLITKKPQQKHFYCGFVVVPPGIEPGTQGFSVLCSTNWAMAPDFCFSNVLFSFGIAKVDIFSLPPNFFEKIFTKNAFFCVFSSFLADLGGFWMVFGWILGGFEGIWRYLKVIKGLFTGFRGLCPGFRENFVSSHSLWERENTYQWFCRSSLSGSLAIV